MVVVINTGVSSPSAIPDLADTLEIAVTLITMLDTASDAAQITVMAIMEVAMVTGTAVATVMAAAIARAMLMGTTAAKAMGVAMVVAPTAAVGMVSRATTTTRPVCLAHQTGGLSSHGRLALALRPLVTGSAFLAWGLVSRRAAVSTPLIALGFA